MTSGGHLEAWHFQWTAVLCMHGAISHASRRPPDVILRRSFTRPSTVLGVEGLGTRLQSFSIKLEHLLSTWHRMIWSSSDIVGVEETLRLSVFLCLRSRRSCECLLAIHCGYVILYSSPGIWGCVVCLIEVWTVIYTSLVGGCFIYCWHHPTLMCKTTPSDRCNLGNTL